jgi:hypothetical protein
MLARGTSRRSDAPHRMAGRTRKEIMTDDDSGRIRIRDQVYPFPKADSMNAKEWHLMKEIAGIRSGELLAALTAGDVDVLVAFAHIAIRRAGATRPTLDELWELNPNSDLEMVGGEDEPVEESDPTPAGEPAGVNGNGSSEMTQPEPGNPPTVTSSA